MYNIKYMRIQIQHKAKTKGVLIHHNASEPRSLLTTFLSTAVRDEPTSPSSAKIMSNLSPKYQKNRFAQPLTDHGFTHQVSSRSVVGEHQDFFAILAESSSGLCIAVRQRKPAFFQGCDSVEARDKLLTRRMQGRSPPRHRRRTL